MNTDLNYFLAFGAGILSFISPCTLPLYPAFLSYITGVSFDKLKNDKGMLQKTAILHTLFFLLGFTMIFLILGLTTSYLSGFFYRYDDLIRQVGGILIVIFGLMIIGVFTPDFLMKDRKFQFKNRPAGYIGSFLIGLAFAAGWTPCTGPILGGILSLAGTNPGSGIWYLLTYSLGFSIPFFLLSFFMTRLSLIRNHSQKIVKVGGYVMIVVGILLYFNGMTLIIRLLQPIFGDFIGL